MKDESPPIIELINREIDGANSLEESARLKEYLARDRGAQNLYDDLVRVSARLKIVEEVEPPRNLRSNIINSIDFGRYAVKDRRSPLKWITDLIPQKAPLRYALVFSLGLFAGVVVYALFADLDRDSSIDVSKLYGTMLADRSSEKLEPGDLAEISLEKVTGTITTMHTKGLVLVQVNLRSQQEIETIFDFDSGFLSFMGYRQLGDAKSSLSISENSLTLRNTGDKRYLLLFDDKARAATSLRVKIMSSGVLVYERPLSTGRDGQ